MFIAFRGTGVEHGVAEYFEQGTIQFRRRSKVRDNDFGVGRRGHVGGCVYRL